ncbi:MAG: hypothetical protein NT040_00980 [Bacteroidetes bacterium]|nr:hypothetical protein [Bacteroidota bacterium]
MVYRFTIFMLLVLIVSPGKTQPFVIHDVLVSSQNARICDIEIDPLQKRICWQSPDDDKLWVCHLDTVSWALTVPDGKEILIDSSLASIANTANSGEWGYDRNGTYIVYNKEISRKRYIALAAETGSSWSLCTLTDAPHRMNPHASRNPADSFVAIHYISTILTNYTKYKFISNPAHEYWIHDFKDAHWANDEQILTGVLKNNHQVGLFDPANPNTPVQLTFDYAKVYSRPFIWRAPEHQDARMLFANANGEQINIFREVAPNSNNFTLYMTFTSPSSNPDYNKIGSPEPCVYDGQSYITFMASSSEYENSFVPGEIWIAKIDSLSPFFRMISDPSTGIRSDPETLATSDSLLVYYTEVDEVAGPERCYRLKKCDTGIGINLPTGNPEIAGNNHTPPAICQNPFKQRISLKNGSGNEFYMLAGMTGKTVWSGKHIERKNFSGLPAGPYILKVMCGSSAKAIRLIKE